MNVTRLPFERAATVERRRLLRRVEGQHIEIRPRATLAHGQRLGRGRSAVSARALHAVQKAHESWRRGRRVRRRLPRSLPVPIVVAAALAGEDRLEEKVRRQPTRPPLARLLPASGAAVACQRRGDPKTSRTSRVSQILHFLLSEAPLHTSTKAKAVRMWVTHADCGGVGWGVTLASDVTLLGRPHC